MPQNRLISLFRFCLFALCCWASGTARAEEQIQFKAETCFANMAPMGICPTIVTVTNRGGALNGNLIVSPQTGDNATRQYVYPLPLPTGSTKRVIVYPSLQGYGGIAINYQSGFRTWDTALPFPGQRDGGRQVGFIGDRTGGLVVRGAQAVRTNRVGQPINDCYCKPESAPDRAAGYSTLAALVIGDGAERLTAGQWQAIRQWVLRGGSLVLVGGANAAYLRAPELASLLPLATATGGSLPRLSGNNLPVGRAVPAAPVAVTTGEPALGATVLCRADDGRALLVSKARGAGNVVYVAFDPLEKPLRGWTETATIWNWILQSGEPVLDRQRINEIVQQKQSAFDQDESRSFAVSRGIGRPRTTAAAPVNPFRISLPDIGIVIGMFVVYFILTVPVTFFVLRRLQKQEWAWITTPILAILFSFGLYLFTADLYKAGMSRRTGGIILASAGEREARFSGFTEIFFPTGGSYKIAIPNAETLETRDLEDYSYGRTQDARAPLETVDMGTVIAPDYPVSNLSFRRLTHTQKLDFGGGITANLRRGESGRIAGTVTNNSTITLRGAFVIAKPRYRGTASYKLGEIKPGETKTLPPAPGDLTVTDSFRPALLSSGNLNLTDNSAILAADTDGESTGPKLGRSVGGDRSVTVIVSLPIAGKG